MFSHLSYSLNRYHFYAIIVLYVSFFVNVFQKKGCSMGMDYSKLIDSVRGIANPQLNRRKR